jgi:thiamine pyridinylase
VPDREAILYRLAQGFEATHPGVHIAFVDTDDFTSNYYKGGLQRTSADIYEIDTILLADMLQHLAPVELKPADFYPEAIAAVTRDGRILGVPHWLCGNFLFYTKGNQAIESASSWDELVQALAGQKSDVLVDLKGSSGLGEWYLTVIADRLGIDKAQDLVLSRPPLSGDAVNALTHIVKACPKGLCRSSTLHQPRTGYYARAFVRGHHAAYIGYSETIYYGLEDAQQNCLPSDPCLTQDQIAVRRLPPFGAEGSDKGVGWVDALAIDKKLTGEKKAAALEFIAYVTRPEGYQAILTSRDTGLLRYLLPARMGLKTESEALYAQFYAANRGRQTGTKAGLNDALRAMGAKLDSALVTNGEP